MKCNNCQTEWNDNGKFTDIKNCPFCGNLLRNKKTTIDENTSFGSVLKEIENRCGTDIWKDRAKAVSVFRDLAPKMKTERLLLMIALESQVNEIFDKEIESAVSKAQIRLMNSLGEDPVEDILLAFLELHDIEAESKPINKAVKANTKDNNLKTNKKNDNNGDKSISGEDKNLDETKFPKITCTSITPDSKNNIIQSALTFADLKVGDIFNFGRFKGRKIKWKVLEKDQSSIYVISTEILCEREFNSNLSNNWLESKLKKWLNDDFYNDSFSSDEKTKIIAEYSDKVTLLSKEEAERLIKKKERRFGSCWWLRSPLDNSYFVWCVNENGDIGYSFADGTYGVRPALNLKFPDTHEIEVVRTLINTVFNENSKDDNLNAIRNDDKTKSRIGKFELKQTTHNSLTTEVNNCNNQSVSLLADFEVGDVFGFGEYGGRKINWKVLEKDKLSIYIISTEILCEREFNSNLSNNWVYSELRKWLNVDFYNASFSTDDKEKIKTVNMDKVTLLSREEADRLMTKEERRLDYWWWLCSPHFDYGSRVCYVFSDGDIYGCSASHSGGVRPALHLIL